LREKYHSIARLQGAQEEPERHGRLLIESDHAMMARDSAIPGQRPSPEWVTRVIWVDSEEIAAMTADLVKIVGNDGAIQQGCVRADEDQVTRHGTAPVKADGRV
jgi:hypothetical protein